MNRPVASRRRPGRRSPAFEPLSSVDPGSARLLGLEGGPSTPSVATPGLRTITRTDMRQGVPPAASIASPPVISGRGSADGEVTVRVVAGRCPRGSTRTAPARYASGCRRGAVPRGAAGDGGAGMNDTPRRATRRDRQPVTARRYGLLCGVGGRRATALSGARVTDRRFTVRFRLQLRCQPRRPVPIVAQKPSRITAPVAARMAARMAARIATRQATPCS